MALYLYMLETPALCTLEVNEDFIWGEDLIKTQFKPLNYPVFNIELMMNETGAVFSIDLEMFRVRFFPKEEDNSITITISINVIKYHASFPRRQS